MTGGPEAARLAFSEAQVRTAQAVFDVVAIPAETPLIQLAGKFGKPCISGADVIVLQAVEQFVLYTGIRPGSDLITRAAALARQS